MVPSRASAAALARRAADADDADNLALFAMSALRADVAALLLQYRARQDAVEQDARRQAQYIRRLQQRNNEQADVIATLKAELESARLQGAFKPGSRYLSIQGGFTLALRRNIAHAGAVATARMLTGEGRGAVSSKNPVVAFEYKAAVAKTLRSIHFHSLPLTDAVDVAGDSANLAVECGFHLVKMDATNSEAIGRSKVHVAVVTSLRSNLGCVAGDSPFDPLLLSSQCSQLSQAADLLEVQHGTGAETHQFALHHFRPAPLPLSRLPDLGGICATIGKCALCWPRWGACLGDVHLRRRRWP